MSNFLVAKANSKFKWFNMAIMHNDTKLIKKNQVTLILCSFTPSDINFKRFWWQKWFWQIFYHKKSTHLEHSYLKYALFFEAKGQKVGRVENVPKNIFNCYIQYLTFQKSFPQSHLEWVCQLFSLTFWRVFPFILSFLVFCIFLTIVSQGTAQICNRFQMEYPQFSKKANT